MDEGAAEHKIRSSKRWHFLLSRDSGEIPSHKLERDQGNTTIPVSPLAKNILGECRLNNGQVCFIAHSQNHFTVLSVTHIPPSQKEAIQR